MGIVTFKENEKYRIFVEGIGGAGRRYQHTEVFYGTKAMAEQRYRELLDFRESHPEFATVRWPKLALPPKTYIKLLALAAELKQSPEEFIVDIITGISSGK